MLLALFWYIFKLSWIQRNIFQHIISRRLTLCNANVYQINNNAQPYSKYIKKTRKCLILKIKQMVMEYNINHVNPITLLKGESYRKIAWNDFCKGWYSPLNDRFELRQLEIYDTATWDSWTDNDFKQFYIDHPLYSSNVSSNYVDLQTDDTSIVCL